MSQVKNFKYWTVKIQKKIEKENLPWTLRNIYTVAFELGILKRKPTSKNRRDTGKVLPSKFRIGKTTASDGKLLSLYSKEMIKYSDYEHDLSTTIYEICAIIDDINRTGEVYIHEPSGF